MFDPLLYTEKNVLWTISKMLEIHSMYTYIRNGLGWQKYYVIHLRYTGVDGHKKNLIILISAVIKLEKGSVRWLFFLFLWNQSIFQICKKIRTQAGEIK